MTEEFLDSILNQQFDPVVWQRFGSTLLLIVVCVAVFVAVCVYLWHLKGKRDESVFTVTRESIGEQSEIISKLLLRLKASKREATTALLLLEEIVVRLHENTDQVVTARVRKFFGDISILLFAQGAEYNPFASLSDWDSESEDYYRDIIFRANKANLSYARHGGKNFVTIRAHRAGSRAMYYTFGAMILGIAVGFGLKWLPAAASAFIANGMLATIQTLFMNGLSLMLAPVVFFSITTSLSNLSGGNEIGRLGGKVVGTYFFTTIMAILIGILLAVVGFSGNVPQLPETFIAVPEEMKRGADISLSDLFISIVPKNIVSPILNGNMLQIIFVAILTGFSLSALGEKVSGLRAFFNEANDLFLKMMSLVIACMPFAAFASMALLVFQSSAATLFVLIGLIVAFVAGCALLFVLYALIITVVGRLSPFPYFKKALSYFLTPFTLSSSSACIPLTMDFCKKKLGVSNKIASFSIPLGATINMDGTCMYMVLSTLVLARMCGIAVDVGTMFKLSVMAFALSVGSPGIPGASMLCIATLLQAAGIPMSALGLLLGINQLIDRFETGSNVNGDIAASVVVAKSENQLDVAAYKA